MFSELTPDHLARILPELSLGSLTAPIDFFGGDQEALRSRGWTELTAHADKLCDRLARGLDDLHRAKLPLVAVYAFDDVWALGHGIAERISGVMKEAYILVEDLWAFRVAPGGRGWPPHRGVADRLSRSSPEYLNCWVAISDVEIDRACMSFLPFELDAAYGATAEALEREPADLGPPLVAAPVPRGTALAWNANVLHAGGECSPEARGPRISLTFSLCLAGALGKAEVLRGVRPVDRDRLRDPWQRLEIVARQIQTYGQDQIDVSDEARQWAALTATMAEQMRRRSAPPG